MEVCENNAFLGNHSKKHASVFAAVKTAFRKYSKIKKMAKFFGGKKKRNPKHDVSPEQHKDKTEICPTKICETICETTEASCESHTERAVEDILTNQTTFNYKPFASEAKLAVLPPSADHTEQFVRADMFTTLHQSSLKKSSELSTLEATSQRLTKNCTTELEKARVLFVWVVQKDLAERVSRQNISRQNYHKLFQDLCRFAGLQCEIVQGYSKGSGYQPGMRISRSCFRNSWTAVSIDNKWGLVNCTWAARHGREPKHQIDWFYFLPDPEDYIFQHFPDNQDWQLLKHPISRSKFINLPVLGSAFFVNQLVVPNSVKSKITTSLNQIKLEIIVPEYVDLGCRLSSTKLVADSDRLSSVHLRSANIAMCTVDVPQSGHFNLTLYVGQCSDELESAFSVSIVRH